MARALVASFSRRESHTILSSRLFAATRSLVLVVVAVAMIACGQSDLTAGSGSNPGAPKDPKASAASDDRDSDALGESGLLALGFPEELANNSTGWPSANRDLFSTRATFDSNIDSANVASLSEAWYAEVAVGGPVGSIATNPVVVDGVVYFGDLTTNVYAVELDSGKLLWRADNDISVFGPSGVAVGWGKVFSNRNGSDIAAYDAQTGKRLWSTDITSGGRGKVDYQPVVGPNNIVFAATSALASPGSRGTLFALNQSSGEVIWSFDTVESPDLWGHPEINSGGGSWYPPVVDAENDIVYWGTSNPWPVPGAPGFPAGSSRPGDNRWTNSLVALKISSGELMWANQWLKHDLYDRDTVVVAYDESSEMVVHSGKLGRVRAFDPATHEPVWDVAVGMHQNDDLETFDGDIKIMPGSVGGVETPIALADSTIYAVVVNAPIGYTADKSAFGLGVELGSYPSEMVALDARTGELKWSTELPGDAFGAATVVNDLVITTTLAGKFVALKRDTGSMVFQYQLPGGTNGWPAVVDNTILLPISLGDRPGVVALRIGS